MCRLVRVAIASAGLLLAFGGWVQADTVVLTDGGRVSGRVTSTPRSVTVESSGGILTLPAWRVARVEKEGQVVEPTRAPESAAPVAPASEGAKPAAQKAGAASLQEVLNRKIDVDFEGMPLPDALAYVRELTGMNMAISPGVRTATTPVYLHLKGIRVKAVLDLVVEAGNFRYAVRQGDIVWVSEGLPPGALSSRAYDATDLLLSKEDLFSPTIGGTAGATGGAGTGGGRAAGGGVNPQFSPGRSGGGGIQTGGSPGQGVSYGAPASARAGTLILLIKGTCGPETWMYPASPGVLSAGGPAAGANVARNPGF